jgi:hypothetical protein
MIVAVEDLAVASKAELAQSLLGRKPGDTVRTTVIGAGGGRTVSATLGSRRL